MSSTRYMVNHLTREIFIIAPANVDDIYTTLKYIRKDKSTRSYYVYIVSDVINQKPIQDVNIPKPFAEA